jgi:NAD-dependent dihydropyrimidine dehydrogenase PreA subunit
MEEKFMPRRITELCTCDGSCKDVCPVECISEGSPIYIIDEDICIDCGACESVCPSDGAIIEV